MVNTASLYFNPIIASVIFGPEGAAAIWLVLRLFLTPASIISDPIRRDYFANFTNGHFLCQDVRRSILTHKVIVFGIGTVLVGSFCLFFWVFKSEEFLGHFGGDAKLGLLGLIWALAVVFNAPSTGLIPVLGLARLQFFIELLGFLCLVGSLFLGLLSLPLGVCMLWFLSLTIFINFLFGIVVDFSIWSESKNIASVPALHAQSD